MAAKKKVTKKAPAKKAAKKTAKKAPAKKAPAKKAARGTAAKKAPVKKAAKKAPAKREAKKTPAKKTPVKKAAKKAPAKREAKKTPAKKAPVKKAPVKKAAKKTPAKSAAAKGSPIAAAKVKAATVNDVPKKVAPPKKPAKPVKLTAFVIKQRQNLLDLRDQLMDAMYGVQQDTLRNSPEGSEASGSGMHQGDAGSDAYDRDFALNLLSKEQDALQEIEAALERIENRVYGVCEMSGRKIPHARLEAIPFARLTVECQTQWEKEYPQRKFRSEDALHYLQEANNGVAVSLDEAAR